MASAFQNFELGLAGTGDLVDHYFGGKSTLAADVYGSQTAKDQGLDPQAAQKVKAQAKQAEQSKGIVEKAAKKTEQEIGTGLGKTLWIVGGVGAVLLLAIMGLELRAVP